MALAFSWTKALGDWPRYLSGMPITAYQRREHGRDAAEDADLLARDFLKRRLRIETHLLDDLRSEENAEQHVHGERVDVERRQHRKHALAPFDQHRWRTGGRCLVLLTRAGQISVREHRALGQSRRTAGILEHGNGLGRIGNGYASKAPSLWINWPKLTWRSSQATSLS